MAELKETSNKEKKVTRNFNLWAAFFGLFYYMYKGLWKKGLLLSTLTMLLVFLIHFIFPRISISALSTGISVGVFGAMANLDLHRKGKNGETMWKELPALFNRSWLIAGIFILTFFFYATSPLTSLSDIENTSEGLVTEIVSDQYGIPLEAVDVRILEEIEGEENLYYARATMSNNFDLYLFIEYFPESHYIEVFVPEEEIYYLNDSI